MKRGPRLDGYYDRIEAAAVAGVRCPMGYLGGRTDYIPSEAFSTLASEGRIKVEIFLHNYRVVTILTGPHAGKQTASAPMQDGYAPRPYKVISKSGTRVNGSVQDPYSHVRIQPSTPRDLSAPNGLRDQKEPKR